jgi:thiol:disulfide interchange protein DsbD
VLVLTGADGRTDAFTVSAAPGVIPAAVSSGIGIAEALLFAFLGGLILNLMPCVLPVLSMKALALATHASVPAAVKRESLGYAAGVLLSFLALAAVLIALRAGGSAAGWGFQLQQPMFVGALALVMFAVGLNLSGLYQFGVGRFAGSGQALTARGGVSGSFFTGVLAVIVATPCTAPFMAAALGFAATQPAPIALAVFAALALGFAAPFVAVAFSPRLLRRLPKPGPWMDIFKQALAFPMYGAAVWLTWVLGQQAGPDGLFFLLAAALVLAFGLWVLGKAQTSQRRHAYALATAAIALLGAIGLTSRISLDPAPAAAAASAGSLAYEPYSAARLTALRAANTPIFVNATAAWCITCLVNERVALSGEGVEQAFSERGVVALKADWTNQNPEITALLSEYGRSGVPLYLYFAPGAPRGRVLPQILTESAILDAIQAGT